VNELKNLEPFSLDLDFESGKLSFYNKKAEIRLSDLAPYVYNTRVVEERLARNENPVIYSYYDHVQPSTIGEMNFGITIILPGKIGDEYNFTRGHYHTNMEPGEIYIGIQGEGILLAQRRNGSCKSETIERGRVVYAPGDWNGHRTVNTGKDKLIFFTIEQAASGHDYETVRRNGLAKLVVEEDGKPKLIDNPKYKP